MYGTMRDTVAERHSGPHAEDVSSGSGPYWGWSHRRQRMEFMDLPSYMDSFRQGYDAAFGDLLTRVQQLGWPATAGAGPASVPQAPAAWGSGPVPGWPGRRRHHRHGHHKHEGRWGEHHGHEHEGCGCENDRDRDGGWRHDRECDGCEHDHGCRHGRRKERDCRCDCCIVDADIIVYGHCGEVRVVPIEVINDSRKIRENVDVQVSQVRSGGGKVLPWPTLIQPEGPLNLEPCRATRLELLVQIACGAEPGEASVAPSGAAEEAPAKRSGSARRAAPATDDAPSDASAALTALAAQRDIRSDVDRCEVGYTTIRLDGCLVRPIVVAIAVLPVGCDSYRVGCSCSCCC
jgi:hypothetical protein